MKRLPHFVSQLIIAIVITTIAGNSAFAKTDTTNTLSGLKKEHPRIFLTPERLNTIQSQAATDPILAALIEQTKQDAEKMLTEPIVEYKIPDGKRLLRQSRYAIRRIWTFSLAYRLTNDQRFLDAAVNEMLTASKFKDWNPPHFLDTAEMTAAFAIGYDWLYDAMDPKDRETICNAMVKLGMDPGIKILKRGGWWTSTDNNWNQVCNGGLILGALAIADEKPELADQMIGLCLKSLPNGLKAYRPAGAYPEGPGYWVYGTTFTVLTILGLDSALGHDFDIHKSKALEPTVEYRLHMEGPSHLFFNYADSGLGASPDFATLGLAYIYQKPSIAQLQIKSMIDYFKLDTPKVQRPNERFAALNVIYYPECKKMVANESFQTLPLDSFFEGRQDIVTMRSEWNNPNALFLGIKAGDNQTNHGHLDVGSFILDANGVRWAIDLGSDNYNMPGYFSKAGPRWKYYRMTNLSHNTLVIGNKLQNIRGISKVTDFQSTPEATHATIDMTDAYKDQAKSVVRKASLLDRNRVVIRDTVTAPSDEVRWGMVTKADITLDGSRAILNQGKHQMDIEITSPANAKFEIVSTKPNTDKEHQNKGTRMLAFTVKPDGDKPLTLEVVFTPVK